MADPNIPDSGPLGEGIPLAPIPHDLDLEIRVAMLSASCSP